MNDDRQIEAMLGDLPWRKPSAELDARVSATLASAADTPRTPGRRLVPLAIAASIGAFAGAAVGLALGWQLDSDGAPAAVAQTPTPAQSAANHAQPAPPPAAPPQPEAIVTLEQRPELEPAGVIEIDGGPPIHLYERDLTQRRWLVGDDPNHTVEVTRPQRQIILIQHQPL